MVALQNVWSSPVQAVVKRISAATALDTATDEYGALSTEIERLSSTTDVHTIRYLCLLLDQLNARISAADAIREFMALGNDSSAPNPVRAAALAHCAASTVNHPSYSAAQNYAWREHALALLSPGDVVPRIIILTSWLFAAVTLKDLEKTKELPPTIESLLATLSPDDRAKPSVAESIARYQTHRAKQIILELQTRPVQGAELTARIVEVRRLYDEALKSQRHDAHRRSNFRIELGDCLAHLAEVHPGATSEAAEALDAAYRGLDGNSCKACHAYFYQQRAFFRLITGRAQFNQSLALAKTAWDDGIYDAQKAVGLYESIGHHLRGEAEEIATELKRHLEEIMRPAMIFLSHKSANKERILRFDHVLRLLGFQPWLDATELFAGKGLERSLFEGFQQSCACVFFITREFKDEKYLKKEVEYALDEESARGDAFRIIPIRLDEDAEIPPILKRFVFKTCTSDLDALYEILRALPVKVGTVHWPINEG